jgi:hypothetical protein
MCCRVTLHVVIMLIFLVSFFFYNYVDKSNGYWNPPSIQSASLYIEAKNCQIQFLRTEEPSFYSRFSVKREQLQSDFQMTLNQNLNNSISFDITNTNEYRLQVYSDIIDI